MYRSENIFKNNACKFQEIYIYIFPRHFREYTYSLSGQCVRHNHYFFQGIYIFYNYTYSLQYIYCSQQVQLIHMPLNKSTASVTVSDHVGMCCSLQNCNYQGSTKLKIKKEFLFVLCVFCFLLSFFLWGGPGK